MSRPEPVSVHGHRSVDGGPVSGGNVPPGNVAGLAGLRGDEFVIGLQSIDRTPGQSGDQLRPGDGRALHRCRRSSSPAAAWCSDGNAPLSGSVPKPAPVYRAAPQPGLRSTDISTCGPTRRSVIPDPGHASWNGCVSQGLFQRGALLRVVSTRPRDMRRRRGGVRSHVPSNDGNRQLRRELRTGDGAGCGV
jgi:hypothetical protein